MVEIAQIRAFRSVAVTGSVRAAAEHLRLTPSAVSQQIKSLERATHVALLRRTGRRVELTDAGRNLLGEVEHVFDSVSALENRFADFAADRSHRITIGHFGSAGARWLPDVVAYLHHRRPEVSVELTLTDGTGDRLERDIELLVGHPDSAPADPAYTTQHLADDPYLVAVPADSPLASRHHVPLADLVELPWIDSELRNGWCRTLLLDACRAAGIAPRFQYQAHDYATALEFVDRGLGITVLPGLGFRRPPAGVVAVPLSAPAPVRSIFALTRKDSPLPELLAEATAAFVDLQGSEDDGTGHGGGIGPGPRAHGDTSPPM